MRLARRLTPTHDTVFSLCVSAAIAILCIALATSCSRPLPDLGKIARGQYSRTVHSGAQTCQAWLPLVVRASAGQDSVAPTIEAAQPWVDSVGAMLIVPAQEGEDATLTITIDACPVEYVTKDAPFCHRLAQTHQWCDGSVYRQEIQVFVQGDATQDYFVLMHELGHAFGVADGADDSGHSRDPRSIMFHSIDIESVSLMGGEFGPDAVTQGPTQWVRAADSASVRKTWGFRQ